MMTVKEYAYFKNNIWTQQLLLGRLPVCQNLQILKYSILELTPFMDITVKSS